MIDQRGFQFTPARGGRHPTSRILMRSPRFNSRPRVAGDGRTTPLPRTNKVSIHARAWRATAAHLSTSTSCSGFNSRPRVAGDQPFLSGLRALS